jgi:hypothetical protein
MAIAATHKETDYVALASVVAAHVLYPESICVLPVNRKTRKFDHSFHCTTICLTYPYQNRSMSIALHA